MTMRRYFPAAIISTVIAISALGGNEEHWAWSEEKEDRQRYRTWGEWRETGQEEDGKFEIEGHEPLDLNFGNMPVGPALRQVGG